MAEAFAHIYGGDAIEAYSAGSHPSGVVNPKAIESMKEIGYDLSNASIEVARRSAPSRVGPCRDNGLRR